VNYDPERDTFTQIEEYLRTVALRLLLVALASFCIGYLVG
jgi:hypothetical protein